MKYKDGVYTEVVSMQNGRPKTMQFSIEIEHAMQVADALSKAIAGKEIIITAGFDGKHMAGSKHYSGNAFDMRKWHYTNDELSTLFVNLCQNLGEDYDVVMEATHVHVEYDPKSNARLETTRPEKKK
jgi:outer membrane receptor for ferric coprogen and ferric-rhodotorulic acid